MAEHIVFAVLIALLIFATVTDLRERIIYDRVIVVGSLFAIFFRIWFQAGPWWEYLLTGLSAVFVLATIAVLTGGRAIGGGDIKLFGMIGLMVGWESFFYIFLFSHVIAAVFMIILRLFKRKAVGMRTEFPFAPFILAGTLLTYWLRMF